MQASQFQIRDPQQQLLHVHRFLPDAAPRAALLVIHGMAEHGARYARFAQAACAAGVAVFAPDLPGHGKTARRAHDLGHFADRDGWAKTIAFIHRLRQHIETTLPGTPLCLLGHSMGSFVLQDYVIEHGAGIRGAIFSATSGDLGRLRAVGLALIKLEALWFGARHRSAVGEFLTFREFNRKFRPNRTDFDWLSRDPAEVDRYVGDPLCGFRCSCRLWMDLLEAGGRLRDPERLAQLSRELGVLLISGSEDPATHGVEGPRALQALYEGLHLPDVSLRIYAGARHELLNETCRDEVAKGLIDWTLQHAS